MAEVELTRWDLIDHLESDEDIVSYLRGVLEDGLPEMIAATLVDIARAKGLFATSGPTSHGRATWRKRYGTLTAATSTDFRKSGP